MKSPLAVDEFITSAASLGAEQGAASSCSTYGVLFGFVLKILAFKEEQQSQSVRINTETLMFPSRFGLSLLQHCH